MAEKRTLNLKDKQRTGQRQTKKAEPAPERTTTKAAKKAPPPKQAAAARKSKNDLLEDEESEDDDDEILAEMDSGGKGNTPILFIVAGVLVVLVVVVAFLLLSGRGKNKEPDTSGQTPPPPSSSSQVDTSTGQDPLTGLGTQDFTKDTNWTSSSELVNPDLYTEDIHGLTTRVDYTVKSINNIADFVSYEKRRGTWGGGLELYWLDATYQGHKYVVQVPFKYYKELAETGIIPVQMEVLSIAGASEGQTLNVISYMTLDEQTLKDILKQQSKTK